MKRPLYAALDLHSAYSVLGSMDHSGKTQPRMRFATEAERLRAQVSALKQKRRPVHLTMEAGALTRSSQWDRAAVGRAADHLRAAAQSADPFRPSVTKRTWRGCVCCCAWASSKKCGWEWIAPGRFTGPWFTSSSTGGMRSENSKACLKRVTGNGACSSWVG